MSHYHNCDICQEDFLCDEEDDKCEVKTLDKEDEVEVTCSDCSYEELYEGEEIEGEFDEEEKEG